MTRINEFLHKTHLSYILSIGNNIGDVGTEMLGKGLKTNTALKALNLWGKAKY